MQTLWDYRYAARTQRMAASVIRELLKLTESPDIISFAGGLPAPDVFPVDAIAAATARVLQEHGAQALQYGTTEGYTPLREMIAPGLLAVGTPVVVGLILRWESEGALLMVGTMAGILLANVLNNSLRHTPPGGRVEVAAGSDAAGVHITVKTAASAADQNPRRATATDVRGADSRVFGPTPDRLSISTGAAIIGQLRR